MYESGIISTKGSCIFLYFWHEICRRVMENNIICVVYNIKYESWKKFCFTYDEGESRHWIKQKQVKRKSSCLICYKMTWYTDDVPQSNSSWKLGLIWGMHSTHQREILTGEWTLMQTPWAAMDMRFTICRIVCFCCITH